MVGWYIRVHQTQTSEYISTSELVHQYISTSELVHQSTSVRQSWYIRVRGVHQSTSENIRVKGARVGEEGSAGQHKRLGLP
jgi:hypothetical protein